ncbi:MAG: 16S rRNA (guanine(966)-N(2))-methyltransferase RsmD [Bradymonadaceae bacterium]
MRIIAGEAGGRNLASPPGQEIRPTPERAREALFSTLGNITDAVVADGFAGTGALGCEALSRGARLCYFIDDDPTAIELIEENLERIGAEDRGIILEGDVESSLPLIYDDPDLWLLDPPYDEGVGVPTLEAMVASPVVTEDALIVFEQGTREEIPEIAGLRQEDVREYGKTRLVYFRRVEDDSSE